MNNTTTNSTPSTSISVKEAYERLILKGERIKLQLANEHIELDGIWQKVPGIVAAVDAHNSQPPRNIVDIRPYMGAYILEFAEADGSGKKTAWEPGSLIIQLVS